MYLNSGGINKHCCECKSWSVLIFPLNCSLVGECDFLSEICGQYDLKKKKKKKVCLFRHNNLCKNCHLLYFNIYFSLFLWWQSWIITLLYMQSSLVFGLIFLWKLWYVLLCTFNFLITVTFDQINVEKNILIQHTVECLTQNVRLQ